MVRQLSDFFKSNFFDKSFPLEYRVCMVFFFETYLVSLLFAICNAFLEKAPIVLAIQWGLLVIYTIVVFIPFKIRLTLEKPLLLFLTFISIPLLFLQTTNGGVAALLCSLVGVFTLAIVLKKTQRAFLIPLNIAICMACIAGQHLILEPVAPITTTSMQDLILLLGVFLSTSVGIAILTAYVSNAFVVEHTTTSALIQELETCKESLAESNNKDDLTELYNKRFLYQHLPHEIGIAKRTDQPLCLLMIDLDNFQRIHDTPGQTFGDHVLKQVIHVIQKSLRTYDILARLDDMRVVVVLHNTQFASAFNIAERIRVGVQNLTFDQGVTMTVSIGLTQYREEDTAHSIIERLDDYLNRAINEGRNQIVGGE